MEINIFFKIIGKILFFLILGFIFFLFYANLNWVPRSSVSLNIWAMTRWYNHIDTTGFEKNIMANGERAIPQLKKCVQKMNDNRKFGEAEACQSILDFIENNK